MYKDQLSLTNGEPAANK